MKFLQIYAFIMLWFLERGGWYFRMESVGGSEQREIAPKVSTTILSHN